MTAYELLQNAREAVDTATRHLGKGSMIDSAQVRFDVDVDAASRQQHLEFVKCTILASMTSLSYSVGVFHVDYRYLNRMVERMK